MVNENGFDYGTIGRVLREHMGNNVFEDWLLPGRKEARQMVEQMAMDQLEPAIKMEGLKNAGVNPLTAAAGLAGSGSSAVPQPASSTNPIGDVAGAVGAVAGGVDAIANAKIGLTKLPHEINAIDADASKSFAEIGLTNAQTQGVITDNAYKDEDWQSRLNVQRQQFENMKAEYEVIKSNHDLIEQKIKESISQTELNGSLKDYQDVMVTQINEQTRWMKELNDFRIAHKLFITESGIDGYIWSMVLSGADIEQFDKFVDVYSNYRGSVQSAESKAEYEQQAAYAYSIANAQETAKSLNQIVTDWNTPASGLWSLIEKSFNVSGNRAGKNNIGSAVDAKSNPDEYSGFTQLLVSLNLSLDNINRELETATAHNDFSRIRDLSRQREGLQNFIKNLTFDDYQKHIHVKQ